MTSTHFRWIVLSVCLLCFPPLAVARQVEQLSLHFQDIQVQARKNEPVIIFLKKEIKQRYPDLDISNVDLKKVIVVAKSRKGRGTVLLRIGGEITPEHSISGHPSSFQDSHQYTFRRISLYNDFTSSNGPWQLQFTGNIILRKVILFTERDISTSSRPYPKRNDRDEQYRKRYDDSFLQHSIPLVLPGRSWGTELEGERLCGQRSRNVRDGWDFPDTICEAGSRASYRQGYRPVQLFLRPDIRPLDYLHIRQNVSDLTVSTTLSSGSQDNPASSVSAALGIEIAGHTYTRNISISNRANWRNTSRMESFNISGNWTRRDLENARFFILPHRNCGDFTVQHLQLRVTGIR